MRKLFQPDAWPILSTVCRISERAILGKGLDGSVVVVQGLDIFFMRD